MQQIAWESNRYYKRQVFVFDLKKILNPTHNVSLSLFSWCVQDIHDSNLLYPIVTIELSKKVFNCIFLFYYLPIIFK